MKSGMLKVSGMPGALVWREALASERLRSRSESPLVGDRIRGTLGDKDPLNKVPV